MKRLIFPMAMMMALATPFAGVLSAAPRPDAPVLVLVMPWQDPGAIIQLAGGVQIGPQSALFAALGQSDDPGFVTRLSAAGSWSVRDGTQLAQLCGAL